MGYPNILLENTNNLKGKLFLFSKKLFRCPYYLRLSHRYLIILENQCVVITRTRPDYYWETPRNEMKRRLKITPIMERTAFVKLSHYEIHRWWVLQITIFLDEINSFRLSRFLRRFPTEKSKIRIVGRTEFVDNER